MKKYHLLDLNHNSKVAKQDRIYRTASQIALKYGDMGRGRCKNNWNHVREFWEYDEPYPTLSYLSRYVRISSIKWYIYNKIEIKDLIWSADFLHGLISHARVIWSKIRFPSCEWFNNKEIANLLSTCPFGGKIVETDKTDKIKIYRWNRVPALYLKFSTDSIAFMAGVMAGTKIFIRDNVSYASFNKRTLPYFKKWGIPIEETIRIIGREIYLISPIWPALFVKYMPPELLNKWSDLKNPYNANIYAPVLWKTYMNNNFYPDGIPYLKSRRTTYYEFKGERGAMKELNRLRVENNLTTLDNRIRDVVKEWGKVKEK